MRSTLVIHIAAGAVALLAGYTALYSAKGGRLHRTAGAVFVAAMLTMAAAGLTIAAVRNVAAAINIPAALLTTVLVVTALTTVRPRSSMTNRLDRSATVVAAGVSVASLTFGVQAVLNGGFRNGMPAFPFFMFGVIAALAVVGDVRIMRTEPLRGAPRVARHLWRMSFALFIAALSFFIGQAKVIPEPIRIMPMLGMPVLAVLVTMLYWLWRVRVRRQLRGMRVARVAEAA